jgi:hypothetical protein
VNEFADFWTGKCTVPATLVWSTTFPALHGEKRVVILQRSSGVGQSNPRSGIDSESAESVFERRLCNMVLGDQPFVRARPLHLANVDFKKFDSIGRRSANSLLALHKSGLHTFFVSTVLGDEDCLLLEFTIRPYFDMCRLEINDGEHRLFELRLPRYRCLYL